MFARYGDTRGMDHMRLHRMRTKPASQPEAVSTSFEGQCNPRDLAAGLDRLVAPAMHDTSRKRSLLELRNDIAEYRRNIAGAELLHCRELLLQSGQLIAKAKIFCVPTAVFGRAGLLDLALMKRTPRAQMG